MLRLSVNTCRSVLKRNFSQANIRCRSIHLVRRARRSTLQNARIFDSYRPDSQILTALFIRHASTSDGTQTQVVDSAEEPAVTRIDLTGNSRLPIDQLPDLPDIPPPPVVEIVETLQKLHPNGEVAFESLGLGGYSPVGILQNSLEWLHISCNLPWWGAIAIGTLVCRLLMFPLVISTQKHAAALSTYMPQIQEKQVRLTEARQCGDHYEAAIQANELYMLMKEKGVSPWKSLRSIAIQAPLFLSFFLALRGMTNLPVESLKTGGLWWFTDLTVADPYYILPLITATTLFITIEIGVDTAAASSTFGNMKYVLRCVPLVLLPAAVNFPSAILCYWTMTNFFSLLQVGTLKIPYVRQILKLPPVVKPPKIESKDKKPFIKGLKESWDNMKVAKQLADRERSDAMQFQSAARAPIIKTYKFDPTKQDKKSVIYTKKQ